MVMRPELAYWQLYWHHYQDAWSVNLLVHHSRMSWSPQNSFMVSAICRCIIQQCHDHPRTVSWCLQFVGASFKNVLITPKTVWWCSFVGASFKNVMITPKTIWWCSFVGASFKNVVITPEQFDCVNLLVHHSTMSWSPPEQVGGVNLSVCIIQQCYDHPRTDSYGFLWHHTGTQV